MSLINRISSKYAMKKMTEPLDTILNIVSIDDVNDILASYEEAKPKNTISNVVSIDDVNDILMSTKTEPVFIEVETLTEEKNLKKCAVDTFQKVIENGKNAVKAIKRTVIHLKQIITMKLLHKIAEEQSRAIRKYFVRYIDQINNTVHLYDIQDQRSIEVHGTGISDEIERETVIVC